MISDADLKLQSKPPFATQPWTPQGRVRLNEEFGFDMVFVTHMRRLGEQPRLGTGGGRESQRDSAVAAQGCPARGATLGERGKAIGFNRNAVARRWSGWAGRQAAGGAGAKGSREGTVSLDNVQSEPARRAGRRFGGFTTPQPPPWDGGGAELIGGGLPGVAAWGLTPGYCLEPFQGSGEGLWLTLPSGANAGTYCCAYDGNGNVMALLSAADGSVAARYEYGPFGELIRATGPMAKLNPFRFSTKYQDEETGLVYYGYRYYDSGTERWPNRDPLGEPGFELLRGRQPNLLDDGPNLYTFTHNNPVNYYDVDGCVAPVLIFSIGNAVNNAILACYYCYHLKKCLGTAHDYAQRAAKGMDPEDYLSWLNAAKPGSECAELARGCGVSVIKLVCWVGARFLVLRYEALNPIVK